MIPGLPLLPDDLAWALEPQHSLPRRAIEALAVSGYQRETLTQAQVGKMLSLTRVETEEFLGSQVDLFCYNPQELKREIAALETTASRKIVLSTSPFRYLVAIGQADLLAQMFAEVWITAAVRADLLHRSNCEEVCCWMAQSPSWLHISELSTHPEPWQTLEAGEVTALRLALEIDADFILTEERLGRRVLAFFGLTPISTISLLRETYRQNLITEPLRLLDELQRAGLRIARPLFSAFLREIQSMGSYTID